VTALLVLAVLAVVLVGLWIYATANRLDRLHVRTDAAWIALESALGRRAVVVRELARAGAGPGADTRLAALAARAERTDREGREDAENALSAALGSVRTEALSPQLAAELADAEARVLLARRFHNDAVRDTLALRGRRPVRVLRLGGTARLPTYFEIAERSPADPSGPRRRPSSRVLLLDPAGRVLLLRGSEPTRPGAHFWFTTGGGTEPGEDARAAGVREVTEETGLALEESVLRGPLWWRRSIFVFDGDTIEAEETYFAAAVPEFTPNGAGHTELERRTLSDARWCGPQDVRTLEAEGERVYPPGLDALLAEAVALVTSPLDFPVPEPRSIP
jgi:8-oxo-dGTP pyrophosphatase MutT (NUDIX family)